MTRRIAREEGIFAGNSAGAAMAGLLQLRDRFTKTMSWSSIFHDHGTRYLGKMFNDDWMREKGFLEKTGLVARDLGRSRSSTRWSRSSATTPSRRAIQVMTRARLLADPGHRRRPHRRLESARPRLYAAIVQGSRGQARAGRRDHAAGVSVRRHLDRRRRARDDDHAGESGGARARLQESTKRSSSRAGT